MMTCVVMPRTKWKCNLVTATKIEMFARLIRELSLYMVQFPLLMFLSSHYLTHIIN